MQKNELNINIQFESLLIAIEGRIETAINKIIDKSQTKTHDEQQAVLLTRKDACILLGISLPTLAKYVASGKLPYLKIGKKTLFDKDLLLKSCKGGGR